MEKKENTTWVLLFDSGSQITIFDRQWLTDCKGLSEEELDGEENMAVKGVGGGQSVKSKKLKMDFDLEAADGRHVILRTRGISLDLSGISNAFLDMYTNERMMVAAVIGTDTLALKQAVIDYRQGSVRLHDMIQIA